MPQFCLINYSSPFIYLLNIYYITYLKYNYISYLNFAQSLLEKNYLKFQRISKALEHKCSTGNYYMKNIIDILLGKENEAVLISRSLWPAKMRYIHHYNYNIVYDWQFLKAATMILCFFLLSMWCFWPFGKVLL